MLVEHPRILVGTDDMYEKIYWGSEPFCSLLTVAPELYGRTITINGVSKAYADDGLAHRVLRRAEGNHFGDVDDPGAVDVECFIDFAEGVRLPRWPAIRNAWRR